MSFLPSVEATLGTKPFANTVSGTLGSLEPGKTSGSILGQVAGPISSELGESPESAAVAELGNLISSLGSLSAQAQSLPLSPPQLPGLPQSGYQPQATDYTQFSDDSN